MTYVLLDSGGGRKLERIGPYTVDRQAPVAHWKPRLDAAHWKRADAFHVRSEKGGGHWDLRRELPESWEVQVQDLTLQVKLTPFGHMGIFPEHAGHWGWLRELAGGGAGQALGRAQRAEGERSQEPPLEVLHLFGYTGASSIACARAGMRVTHVDAAHSIVEWGKANAALGGVLPAPIRWIVDDCATYMRRELQRARRYQGVILDPPTYGRGPKGNVFKIEDDLMPLLDQCVELLGDTPRFVLFTCHTPGFTPLVLENLLAERLPRAGAVIESGEMTLAEERGGRLLPAGAFARWSAPARG